MGLVTVWFTFLYTLSIALLMVSRLPVFSGKRVGKRVPPEMVLPVFVMVVLFFALLVSYPWQVAHPRNARLPCVLAARMAVLSRTPAQGCSRRRARPPPRRRRAMWCFRRINLSRDQDDDRPARLN